MSRHESAKPVKKFAVGQVVNGLRVGISIDWNKYPNHLTRQIRITVGKLTVLDALWSEDSRALASEILGKLLEDVEPTLFDEFNIALMEVVL